MELGVVVETKEAVTGLPNILSVAPVSGSCSGPDRCATDPAAGSRDRTVSESPSRLVRPEPHAKYPDDQSELQRFPRRESTPVQNPRRFFFTGARTALFRPGRRAQLVSTRSPCRWPCEQAVEFAWQLTPLLAPQWPGCAPDSASNCRRARRLRLRTPGRSGTTVWSGSSRHPGTAPPRRESPARGAWS